MDSLHIRKKGALNGLLLGLAISFLYVVMYYLVIYASATFAFVFAWGFIFKFLLPICTCAYFVYLLRKQVGGYWPFRQAVTGIFIMILVAYATNFIVTEGLFGKLIAPGKDKIISAKTTLLYTTYIRGAKGISQTDKDKRIKEIQGDSSADIKLSLGSILAYIAQLIIVLFVISLAFAAIFKKEPLAYQSAIIDPTS